MFSFIEKLLKLSRPYSQRLALGVLMGLLAGLMEPLLMLSVKMAVEVAFPSGVAYTEGFSTNSVPNFPAFISELQQPTNEVSTFIESRFSPATQQKLSAYPGIGPAPMLLQESLLSELNLIVLDPSLYNPQRFAGVKLSTETTQVLAENPRDADIVRLNRLLLQDAYPGEIVVKPFFLDKYLDKYPSVRKHLAGLADWFPHTGDATHSSKVILVILTIPIMMLLRGLVSYLNVYFLQWVAIRAITDLRTKLFTHLINMPLGFLNKVSSGELISRVGNDTGALHSAISNSLLVLIKDPATLIGLLVTLLWQQPMLTLVSMIVFPICLVPIIVYARKVRKSSRDVQTQSAELFKIMHESFTGNRIIKAYNLEGHVLAQFREASWRAIGSFMRGVRAGEIPGPLIEFVGAVGVTCLFYYIVFLSRKPIDAGDFLLFVGCIFSMYRPIKSLSRLYNQMGQASAASERVFELLDTPSTQQETTNPKPLKAAGAEIKFDAINFNYGDKPVLHDFQLTIQPGQMVAFVGSTGSGKTTITNLLLRFYDPQSGAVRIGDVDIRDVTTVELRSQIAVVTQETLLFDESIRRNIELGRPGATETEIIAAAKHAHAHEFIVEKPEGYNTLIGEKGVTLSGGQKQRLAIARAILKNAPILILDEATSALDTQSERIVQAALEELMQSRTTLCVAHRLSTIQRADVIVVLEQGRIVEQGRHEDLMARNGVYRRLYELQFQK